jgi:DNA gyrase/topoisomerase IV subunit A
MKQQISKLYTEYGRYINKFRSFPSIYDGLKIVERRLLYSLFERAKDHNVKSAEVVGWCIGQYHPHGDSSAYGSLVQLVNGGLVVGQGNWGSDSGIVPCEAAAMRYTEVKSSKFVLDLAFDFIKYVKQEELELKEEPLFLPTKLPFCLVNKNYTQGIGFGSRTVIPSYNVKDLVKRLKWLLGYDKKEPIIRPLTNCVYISKDKDFQELLKTGKGKIEYKGTSEVDYANKSVIVKSVPPSKSLTKILKALENDIQIQKTIGFIDESTSVTRVRFTSLKRSLTLDQLNKKINYHLIGSMTFECNMCDSDGNVVLVSIDDMLIRVYNNYLQIVELVLKSNISKLQKDIDEMIMLAKIKLVLPKWLKEFPDDTDKVIQGIHNDTQISIESITLLFDKYTISRMLKIKTDIDKLELEKQQVQTNLNNLKTYVWNDMYEKLMS